jgi:predicted  nucleic acid-binding Zn-ribbon protein
MNNEGVNGGASSTPGATEPTLGDRLLELEATDTEVDQLRFAAENNAAVAALRQVEERRSAWVLRRDEIDAELERLAAKVDADEREDADLHAHRVRLEAQLKTVIAPREAEALMNEIATIDARRDELDNDELAALERQAELDDELLAHQAEETVVGADLERAGAEAERVRAEAEHRLAGLVERSRAIRADLPDDLQADYDRHRAQFGVGAAKLVGHRCEACHLDLSPGELDTVSDEAAGRGLADCPCGRLVLVLPS